MQTIHELTSAGKPFPDYATMAENQARLDYAQDQDRYAPPFRDKRKPCANPGCSVLCEGTYCSPTCEAADNAAIASMAAEWEARMLYEGGCQRTRYYADADTGRVLLGRKDIAGTQYTHDEAAGGLVGVPRKKI